MATFELKTQSLRKCTDDRLSCLFGHNCHILMMSNLHEALTVEPIVSYSTVLPLLLCALCTHFISSVPSFKTEWYWKQLMDGNPPFVEFHNRVYGCSGVMPNKFPCTGPNFTWVWTFLALPCFPDIPTSSFWLPGVSFATEGEGLRGLITYSDDR